MDLTILEMIRDKQHKGCFLVNSAVEAAPHDKDTNAIICQNEQQLENAFYEVIKRGQDQGEISGKQTPRALARFLFNTIVGIRVTGKSATDCVEITCPTDALAVSINGASPDTVTVELTRPTWSARLTLR